MRIYTKVSKAYWCTSKGNFDRAEIPEMKIWDEGPNEVFWLDKLFEGGILIPEHPENRKRALTILLTGPPGSGKSTLAIELCHRWSKTYRVKELNDGQLTMDKVGLSSLYITSETDEEWVLNKARTLGWNIVEKYEDQNGKDKEKIILMPEIWQTADFQRFLQDEMDSSKYAEIFLDSLRGIFTAVIDPNPLVKELIKKWNSANVVNDLQDIGPSVLVIDSINTVEPSKRSEIFERFMKLVTCGPRIILTVLESSDNQDGASFWEYLSDIVIRLDRKFISDYLIRTIEIVKARYQSHIWGKHQLKIYAPTDPVQMETYEKRRAHPYRKQGGIFIYPSIHYYLSVYKHLSPEKTPEPFDTPITRMKEIFEHGFPRGRCTGFIGMRGGHKSHLGYLSILSRATTNERGLIISLRDDEGMARQTLQNILNNETDYTGTLNDLILEDKIEILYFPPGYVTPEEFFHRVFMSIQRLKSYEQPVSVLFNSLDQLSSRFPLCAREQIFIPGLIATLSAENVTSFFIAVQEAGQPPEQYGLLSMADALISFNRERFSREDYIGHLNEGLKLQNDRDLLDDANRELPKTQQVVTMRIVRFAGGQAAGAGGLLELVHTDTIKAKLYKSDLKIDNGAVKSGLVFIPFSATYAEGECFVRDFSIPIYPQPSDT
jgi:KaiC/GvpD/RAD55 family RecA-like ATPase